MFHIKMIVFPYLFLELHSFEHLSHFKAVLMQTKNKRLSN